jgi:hypothetical protein
MGTVGNKDTKESALVEQDAAAVPALAPLSASLAVPMPLGLLFLISTALA